MACERVVVLADTATLAVLNELIVSVAELASWPTLLLLKHSLQLLAELRVWLSWCSVCRVRAAGAVFAEACLLQ